MNSNIEYETGQVPVSPPGPPFLGAAMKAEAVDAPPPGRPWQDAGPPPAGRRGIPTWAIVLIAVGGALILACCGITTVTAVLGGGDNEPRRPPATVAASSTPEPTEEPSPTPEPTEEPTEERSSEPLDRLPDYWAAYGCDDFACILDAGEPGMRPWWVRSIEEHPTYAAVQVDPEADPVWVCRNVKGLLYLEENFRVEVYDGTGTRQLAVYSAWSDKCVPR